MINDAMARGYFRQADGRRRLISEAFNMGHFDTTVREAQECVELLLKAALRLVGIEPAHTHDVGDMLRAERTRFPQWFTAEIDRLALISSELAGSRGPAFYGDESHLIPPSDIFDRAQAERALEQAEFVYQLCRRLFGAP